jgi:predicted ATPase
VARATKRVAAHDVFISYSSKDRARADAICAALEGDGVSCWIAPRDGTPGTSYAKLLVDAITASRIVVLVFSRNANRSEAVLNELEIAFSHGIAVLPVRIENVLPTDSAEFYLKRRHWFDAHADFETHLPRLAPAVRAALAAPPRTRARRDAGPAPEAPQAPAAPRGNLPRQATTFVGRAADVERVVGLLGGPGLVTIAGTGGVGKTRVALRAAEILGDPPDGAWFADLAPLENAGLVASTILTALGAAQLGEQTPFDQLLAYLKDRRTLLLLDNCERKLGEVARVAAAILASCRHVTLLATSREPLNVAGEHVHRLSVLDAPAAAQLFADRARLADPRFELGAANARVVDEICVRLDGIPLAIELAAARVRMISVEELSRRLTERFRVLTGGSRTALPHQQTMRALIDWSYDVLSVDEKALFLRMAAFSGGFTLEAAGAVCSDDAIDEWAVLDLLSALVDKSLVVADVDQTGQRYRLLQTIEEYAHERLAESGEGPALARWHATFFATAAQDAYREWAEVAQPGWLARLRPDLENFRAALNWTLQQRNDVGLGVQLAADVMPLFLRLTLLAEAIGWSEAALAAEPELPAAVDARLHYGLSMLYNNQGSSAKAGAAAERAVASYAQSDDARGHTRSLSRLAVHDARQSRFDEATAHAQQALERARGIGDRRLLAATLLHCASVFRPEQIDRARAQFAEGAALYRSLSDDEGTVRALEWQAVSEARAGSFDRAIEALVEALELAEGDARMYVANNLAATLAAQGDARGLDVAREAFALANEAHHPTLVANSLASLAAASASADAGRAARLFGYARARRAELDWQPDNTDVLLEERLTAELRATLGDAQLQELIAHGASLPEREALAEAALV